MSATQYEGLALLVVWLNLAAMVGATIFDTEAFMLIPVCTLLVAFIGLGVAAVAMVLGL